MHPPLLDLYLEELGALRDEAARFAEAHPKVAARLALESGARDECPDPHVERLLEGCAFLAARVRQEIEAGHPRFTGPLVERWMPALAAHVPVFAVVRLLPDPDDPSLVRGPVVAPGSHLVCGSREQADSALHFRVAHEVRLWPLRLDAARAELAGPGPESGRTGRPAVAAASIDGNLRETDLVLSLMVTGGHRCRALPIRHLDLFVEGDHAPAQALHALLLHRATGVVVDARAGDRVGEPAAWCRLPATAVSLIGLDPAEGLLPRPPLADDAIRSWRELAAFPERARFLRISGLASALRASDATSFVIRIRVDSPLQDLQRLLAHARLVLHATPVANLQRRMADRLRLDPSVTEHRVVVDRARPAAHEIVSVVSVIGLDASGLRERARFPPLQAPTPLVSTDGSWRHAATQAVAADGHEARSIHAGHSLRRVARSRAPRVGGFAGAGVEPPPTSTTSHDLLLSVADPRHPPWPDDVAQLAVEVWCSQGEAAFDALQSHPLSWRHDLDAPIAQVDLVAGPSRPLPGLDVDRQGWAAIGMLKAGLQDLLDPDRDATEGASGLVRWLAPLDTAGRGAFARARSGVLALRTRTTWRRLGHEGTRACARGLVVQATIDASAFLGIGAHLFGAVLQHTLALRAPPGSFVDVELQTRDGQLVGRWSNLDDAATGAQA